MGKEAKVELVEGRKMILIRAHLDSQHLELGPPKRLRIPLTEVSDAKSQGDLLTIKYRGGSIALHLGAKEAKAWVDKILNPPSLAKKLGLNKAASVLVTGNAPKEILGEVELGATNLISTKPPPEISAALVLHTLTDGKEVSEITSLAKKLPASSALWLVYEKGKPFNGDTVIMTARECGLKDTKVARVSESHAALRFIKAGPNK